MQFISAIIIVAVAVGALFYIGQFTLDEYKGFQHATVSSVAQKTSQEPQPQEPQQEPATPLSNTRTVTIAPKSNPVVGLAPVVEPQPSQPPAEKEPVKEEIIVEEEIIEEKTNVGKIKISSVQTGNLSSPSLIILRPNLETEEKINITGWSLESKKGKIIIPQGVEKYCHYYNSYKNGDIFVKQGDTIYVSSAFNPLGMDRNFRPNKCMGYLLNDFKFPVPFSPGSCPSPKEEDIAHLGRCCQEFIRRIGNCQIPDYSDIKSVLFDPQCREYINRTFNHLGCFINYSGDENFVGNNWYIYLDRNIIASDDCDTLYLKDRNGLLIDEYEYGQWPVCK